MATYTDNYQLTKPTYAEQADIGVINSNMNKIDEVMHSSQISLAPAYDSTQTYAEGDVVMYELLMYKCISPTTGAWDGSKWERTTASESGGGGSAELDILGEGNGAVVSFADGASAELAKCIADINPTQDLHGYSKPWAGGTGKNLFSGANALDGLSDNNGLFTNTSTDTKSNLQLKALFYNGSTLVDSSPNMDVTSAGRVSISRTISSTITKIRLKHNGSQRDLYLEFPFDKQGTYTISLNVTGYNPTVVGGVSFDNVMIESGSSMTTYEPYSNICPISGSTSVTVTVSDGETSTTTIPLGQTVYGGQLNVLTGELTIDRQIVDLGSLTWTRTDNSIIDVGYWFYANITGKVTSRKTINSNYRTSQYASITQLVQAEGSGVDFVAIEAGGDTQYRIIDSRYTDATAFKTAMNGVQMCYFLATPQTVQLTPQEVNSLLGQNNISADTGEVDIVYVKASAPIQPNPTGTPTATLKKLGIEGTVFELEGGGGGSSSGINYSTTEQVIGTWIDGKTLYQKTFDLTAVQLTDNTWNNSILGTIGIRIKHFEGLFSVGQIEPSIKYEYYRSATQYFSTQLNDDASDINVRPNMNAGTLYAGIVTVQYTKITD